MTKDMDADDAKRLKLYHMSSQLPKACEEFLTQSGMHLSFSTRYAYAFELRDFFSYLVRKDENLPEDQFADSLRGYPLPSITQISPSVISEYMTYHTDRGLMPKTLARKRACLSRFFSYLCNMRYMDYNPVNGTSRVSVPSSDKVIHLNLEEQVKFIDSVDSGDFLSEGAKKYHSRYALRDTALVTLLLDTGLRVSEASGIRKMDVNLKDSAVTVKRKGGDEQTVPFSSETKELLSAYLEERAMRDQTFSEWSPLFATRGGKKLSVRAIEVLVKKYSVAAFGEAKGGRITPHKLRSSFAMTYYRASGNNILSLQKYMGHKTIAATNIYAKATDEDLKNTRNLVADKRDEEREIIRKRQQESVGRKPEDGLAGDI